MELVRPEPLFIKAFLMQTKSRRTFRETKTSTHSFDALGKTLKRNKGGAAITKIKGTKHLDTLSHSLLRSISFISNFRIDM